jgi:hypothetical protein
MNVVESRGQRFQSMQPFPATMIFKNPTNQQIQSADVIALFDPENPGWHEVLICPTSAPKTPGHELLVIDIPVNPANWAAVQIWREKINRLRSQPDPG